VKVLVSYRGIPQSPGWATGDFVVKALRTLGHEVYPYAKYYQQNRWVEERPLLDHHRWDLILFMECNDGDPQYPELKVTPARHTACWLFDTSYHQDRYRSLVNYFKFDDIFLANPLTVQEYRVWGYDRVHYLPYAFDSEKHVRGPNHEKTMDVALVGSIRDDRKHLAKMLGKRGIDLQLIGGVFREQYVDALASARFVVNQNPPQGRGLLNMRHFEAQAAGSIVIEQHDDLMDNCEAGLFCNMPTYDQYKLDGIQDAIDIFGAIDRETIERYFDGFRKRESYEARCGRLMHNLFPHEVGTDGKSE
jgi:hypothetical protein